MKRTLASVAAAGLLTFGLAACGDDAGEEEADAPDAPAATQEEPAAPEDDAETGAPGAGEDTAAPGVPGEGEDTAAPGVPGAGEDTAAPGDGAATSAAPNPEAAEFCAAASEFASAGITGEEGVDALADLRDVAPEEIQDDLDVMVGELEGLTAEELNAAEPPEGVDMEALDGAFANFSTYLGENCAGGL